MGVALRPHPEWRGRVIFDYGYHLFSVAMWLLGAVEKVYAWITYRPIRTELARRKVPLVKGVDHVVRTGRDAAGTREAVLPLGTEEVPVPEEWLLDSPVVAIWTRTGRPASSPACTISPTRSCGTASPP